MIVIREPAAGTINQNQLDDLLPVVGSLSNWKSNQLPVLCFYEFDMWFDINDMPLAELQPLGCMWGVFLEQPVKTR